ncbi:hypothetical protein [Chitinophaga sp.]|uniref:hypothetical protein n=1 Tax=Chitinophaga sp. TaxID=1869181 RepID=UPI002C535665|nr:hypothetical protein [Chitinophaga sp.]HWV64727.1 hypothetical protein [Chitinophaga sp.]
MKIIPPKPLSVPSGRFKKRKNQADVIPFINRDRFSCNAGDAYQMIKILKKTDVELQAIAQPLDLHATERPHILCRTGL